MKEQIAIIHRPEDYRFETIIDGQVAYVEYVQDADVLIIAHTLVPPALGGQGIASALLKHTLDYAISQHFKVNPVCSFARTYIDRHSQYQEILFSA